MVVVDSPQAQRQEVVMRAHTGFTGGHLGVRKTQDQVQRRAYWRGGGKTYVVPVRIVLSARAITGVGHLDKAPCRK